MKSITIPSNGIEHTNGAASDCGARRGNVDKDDDDGDSDDEGGRSSTDGSASEARCAIVCSKARASAGVTESATTAAMDGALRLGADALSEPVPVEAAVGG